MILTSPLQGQLAVVLVKVAVTVVSGSNQSVQDAAADPAVARTPSALVETFIVASRSELRFLEVSRKEESGDARERKEYQRKVVSDYGESVCAAKESVKSDSLRVERGVVGRSEVYVSQVSSRPRIPRGTPWSTMGLLMGW